MANTKKRWTAEEIEILKKHYPTEGDAVFKRLPGRTAKSCRIPLLPLHPVIPPLFWI